MKPQGRKLPFLSPYLFSSLFFLLRATEHLKEHWQEAEYYD